MPPRYEKLSRREATSLNKSVKTVDLFDAVPVYLAPLFAACEYPWEILPKIKDYLLALIKQGVPSYRLLGEGILVGEGAVLHPRAEIEGPCMIGAGCEVRPGAYLRGSVIVGERCVLGNSSEFKNCILLDRVQAPHYNYVGDSVLGNGAHTGAGVICSNLKADHAPVVVHGDGDYETGLRKLGAILGDGADIGCGSVLNPGTVVGKHTSVYPLTVLRGVYPANAIVKDASTVVPRE